MSNWPRVRLSQIATQGQYGLNAPAVKEGSGVRFIRITDIDEYGDLRPTGLAYVPLRTDGLQKYLLEPDDLLIARSGATAGKSTLFKGLAEPAVFAGYLIRFRAKQSAVLPAYLAAFFKSKDYWEYIDATKRAVAQPNINAQELGAIPIPLPPLEEQRRIVDLLSRAESIVRLRCEAQKKAAKIIPALFLDMFGDPAANPRGWPKHRLGDIADVVSGITKGRKLNGKPTTLVPYLRVANVQAGFLDLSEIKEIEATPAEIDAMKLRAGDIVLTEGGDYDKLGRGAQWRGEVEPCIHQNHVFRVRMRPELAVPDYFDAYLQTQAAVRYFLSVAKRTTNLASINMTQLRNLPVTLPPLEAQRAFEERAAQVRSIQLQQKAASLAARSAFDALLAQMFSHQIATRGTAMDAPAAVERVAVA